MVRIPRCLRSLAHVQLQHDGLPSRAATSWALLVGASCLVGCAEDESAAQGQGGTTTITISTTSTPTGLGGSGAHTTGTAGAGAVGAGGAGAGGQAGTVLLDVDFEPAEVGPYTDEAMALEWTGLRWAQGLDEGWVDIVEGAEAHDGKSLRILYPQGGVGPSEGGAQWLVDLPAGYDELYCAYWVKFGTAFDFVRGGKLPGLGGGANNTGGTPPDGTDGWSGRMMWLSEARAEQYVYHPDQPGTYGDGMLWDLGGQRLFVPDEWVHVEHRFVMNTPGQHDGLVQGWWNGVLALERTGLRFRDVDTFAVDVFYFSTFFGGSGDEYAPTKDEHVYFDDFVVATAPISH